MTEREFLSPETKHPPAPPVRSKIQEWRLLCLLIKLEKNYYCNEEIRKYE
jgi:hypothetical protein